MLEAAALAKHASEIVFVYTEGWDFNAFYMSDETAVKASIAEHEALKFRPKSPASVAYVGDGLFCFILLYDYILHNYNAII